MKEGEASLLGSKLFTASLMLVIGAAASSAWAQEDLTRGKTPAQLFSSDCQECHHDPHSVVTMSVGDLQSFLRVHYTASQQSAGVIARYLAALGPAPKSTRKRATAQPSTEHPAKADAAKEDKKKEPQTAAAPADKPSEKSTAKSAEPDHEKKEPEKPSEASAAKPAEPAKDAKSEATSDVKPPAAPHEPVGSEPATPAANPQ